MDSIPQKRCVTCGAEKPLTEFHKCKSKPDGLFPTCKVCACARANAWRKRNPKRDSEIQKGTRMRRKARGVKYDAPKTGTKYCNGCQTEKPVTDFYADRDEPSGLRYRCGACEREYLRIYHERNRDRQRANCRAWAARNPDKIAAMRRADREKFREKRLAQGREYRKRFPEKSREYVMRRRARKKQTSIGPVDYLRIWERDQGVCYLCGLSVDKRDCHYDHIIPLSKGGPHIESNIAVTHSWCNQNKSDRIIQD